MQAIKDFLAKYNAVTHIAVVVWVFLTGAYFSSPVFASYVNSVALAIGHKWPWLAALFVGAVVPLFKYWQGLSDTGKVAVANEVNAKAKAGTLKSSTPLTSYKVGALALCAILLMGTTTACTQADAVKAVSSINATLPAIESAVTIAAGIVGTLDPAIAALITGANTGIQAGLGALQQACAAYIANPNSGEFASIVSVVDNLVNNGDTALLDAVHIVDPASQQKAMTVLASLDALLHVIDGYISAAQPASAVQARMAKRTAKLKQLQAYYSAADKAAVSARMGEPFPVLLEQATERGM